jgi:hypothetical protein
MEEPTRTPSPPPCPEFPKPARTVPRGSADVEGGSVVLVAHQLALGGVEHEVADAPLGGQRRADGQDAGAHELAAVDEPHGLAHQLEAAADRQQRDARLPQGEEVRGVRHEVGQHGALGRERAGSGDHQVRVARMPAARGVAHHLGADAADAGALDEHRHVAAVAVDAELLGVEVQDAQGVAHAGPPSRSV